MVVFAACAYAFGWLVPFFLARALLAKRQQVREQPAAPTDGIDIPLPLAGKPGLRHGASRCACASALAVISCIAWSQVDAMASRVLVVLGVACLITVLICDCTLRIIPWELCLVLLAIGVAYACVTYGLPVLLATLGLSVVFVGTSMLVRFVTMRLGRPCPLGLGDIRILPGLVVFCGIPKVFAGAFACALVMGIWGVFALGRAAIRNRHGPERAPAPRTLPMAPGFFVWLCVGAL